MSLHTMFLWVVPVALVGFALTWFLRDIPLREYTVAVEHSELGSPPEDLPLHLAGAG